MALCYDPLCKCGKRHLDWQLVVNRYPGVNLAVIHTLNGFIKIACSDTNYHKLLTFVHSIDDDDALKYHVEVIDDSYDGVYAIKAVDSFGKVIEQYITSPVDVSDMTCDRQIELIRRMGLGESNDSAESED